ncbi:hypothetical protein BF93_15490 [Brachybacterium phenoliresistens]|uniref:Adhesin domain-containing protein n=1 Tax=Brachybacterium phenoliresistens TaxID=396014 RepID=Z9JVC0_9MICO|nr:hypothetical protein [Brachybacterium phenoliresistens]EWS81746.1 hypothetical protein BF93_15490 [Brachybacterium phenoliresistens]
MNIPENPGPSFGPGHGSAPGGAPTPPPPPAASAPPHPAEEPAPAPPLVHSFSADGPIDMNVQHVRGNVSVRAEHGHAVRVELRPRGEAGRELAARMRIDFSGGHLRVDAPADEAGNLSATVGDLFRGSGGDAEPGGSGGSFADRLGAALRTLTRTAGEIGSGLDLDIVVPVDSRAVVSVGVGDIRLHGSFGRADLKGATGDVELSDVDGTAQLVTGTGSVTIGALRGQATATTGTGSVRISRAERGTLRTRTGVGDIQIRVLEGTATRLDLATGLGDRSVDLTPTDGVPDAGRTLEIEARAGTGSIRVERVRD